MILACPLSGTPVPTAVTPDGSEAASGFNTPTTPGGESNTSQPPPSASPRDDVYARPPGTPAQTPRLPVPQEPAVGPVFKAPQPPRPPTSDPYASMPGTPFPAGQDTQGQAQFDPYNRPPGTPASQGAPRWVEHKMKKNL